MRIIEAKISLTFQILRLIIGWHAVDGENCGQRHSTIHECITVFKGLTQ